MKITTEKIHALYKEMYKVNKEFFGNTRQYEYDNPFINKHTNCGQEIANPIFKEPLLTKKSIIVPFTAEGKTKEYLFRIPLTEYKRGFDMDAVAASRIEFSETVKADILARKDMPEVNIPYEEDFCVQLRILHDLEPQDKIVQSF